MVNLLLKELKIPPMHNASVNFKHGKTEHLKTSKNRRVVVTDPLT